MFECPKAGCTFTAGSKMALQSHLRRYHDQTAKTAKRMSNSAKSTRSAGGGRGKTRGKGKGRKGKGTRRR
jgi:hypothetical protein